MKKYSKPSTEVIQVELTSMIAESDPKLTIDKSSATPSGAGHHGSSDFSGLPEAKSFSVWAGDE